MSRKTKKAKKANLNPQEVKNTQEDKKMPIRIDASKQIEVIKAEMVETAGKADFFIILVLIILGVSATFGIVLLLKKSFITGYLFSGIPLIISIISLTGTNRFNGLRIFQPEDRAMVEFLGKPYCIKKAGLTIIIPWLMSVRAIIPTWKCGINLFSERPTPNEVHIDLKKGGKVQLVEPILWIRLCAETPEEEKDSVLRAIYGVDNYPEASQEVTEDALRTCLNNLTVEEVLSITHDKQKRSWWDVVKENFSELESVIRHYGFAVKGLTISDFNWDPDVVATRQKVFQEERSIEIAELSLRASRREIVQKALESGGLLGEMVKTLTSKKYGFEKPKAIEEASRIIRHFKSAETGSLVDLYMNGGAESGNGLSSVAAAVVTAMRGIGVGKSTPAPPKNPPKENAENVNTEE